MTDQKQITLEYAKEQVKAIKNDMYIQEYADDFYYSSGRHDADYRTLKYWEEKVKELSQVK